MPFQSTYRPLSIPQCNILSYLFPKNTSKQDGDKPLWISAPSPSKALTVGSTKALIGRLALGFDKLGIPKNTAIMVIAPNNIYVPVVYLTTAGSGRIFTAANPSYTVSELIHQMKTIRAELVLADPSCMNKVLDAAGKAGISNERILSFSDDEPGSGSKDGVRDWRSILASEEDGQKWRWDPMDGQPSTETVAVVNFSSGTTGLPKGVCVSHANIVANTCQVIEGRIANTGQTVDRPHSDRWLAFLPWYHAYAQLFTIVLTAKLRQTVYTMSQFLLEPYISYISKYKITTLQVVPPVLVMLSKREGIENCDLSSVSYVMSAAAPLKRDLQNDISKKLGAVIAQSWGMTETTCTGLMIKGNDEDRTGSVGYLLPNTEAMLVDEDGKEVKLGQSGELWVRGAQMLLRYWENEAATRDTKTDDGWLKTGDIAEEKDGKSWIVDRRKELIKVRGFQVAPAELEALLLEHDDIADAAVVGLPFEDEELPKAYVVLRDPKSGRDAGKAIEAYVTEKAARHKRLTGGVAVVDAIPRLLSGKIQRKVVKEWAQRDAKQLQSARPKSKL